MPSKNNWKARLPWINQLPTFNSFKAIEAHRQKTNESLVLLRPKQIVGLEIKPARNPDWTDEEKAKLLQEQMQGNLFGQDEAERQLKGLRKVPFDFYYRYICDTPEGEVEEKHKVIDWEVGALFWNCRKSHGDNWEKPFRAKLEEDLPGKNLMFLMGNIHRFQDQWLIISLIYPPKQRPALNSQKPLF